MYSKSRLMKTSNMTESLNIQITLLYITMSVSFTTYLFALQAILFLPSRNSRNSGLNTFFFIPYIQSLKSYKGNKKVIWPQHSFQKGKELG